MSRVRDALKRANAMPSSAETGALSEVFGVGAEMRGSSEVSAPVPEGSPIESSTPKYHVLLRYRWVKRLLQIAGVRPNLPVQKCQGLTRMGQACRGPAMANGFCRLHGGSRHGAAVEKTRELIGRVTHAR
jgi:hypothetical protein